MGLDMYLTKKVYIGAKWEDRKVKGTVDITINGEPQYIDFNRITYIEEDVAYWRKANAIHKWFVDKCQGGIDECQETKIDYEKLMELLSLAKQVKADPRLAEELLPSQSGFFFGSTNYDSWYFEDIDTTAEQLEKILAEPNANKSQYIYRASW